MSLPPNYVRRYESRTECIRANVWPSTSARLIELAKENRVSVSTYIYRILWEKIEQNFERLTHEQRKQLFINLDEESIPSRSRKKVSQYPRTAGVGYVYIIRCGPHYKIGRAVDPEKRISQMTLPMQPETIVIFSSPSYGDLEKMLHKEFWQKRVHGEWFLLSEDDIARAKDIAAR